MKKVIAIALIVLSVFAFSSFSVAQNNSLPPYAVTEIYKVKNGDTLWGICNYYCSKDCRKIPILQMIDEVKNLNPYLKKRDGLVLTGDKIKIQYVRFDERQ